jgi:hypothetical protein
LYLDLDSAYSEFTRYLKRNKSGWFAFFYFFLVRNGM